MIKNLIFDFGKVLVNHDLQPLLERHFGDDEVSLIGFHKILSDPEFINMCDRGIIPFEKMIDGAIKRYPEYSDAFTFFKDNYLEEITGEIEGMHVLLKKLKQSGFNISSSLKRKFNFAFVTNIALNRRNVCLRMTEW